MKQIDIKPYNVSVRSDDVTTKYAKFVFAVNKCQNSTYKNDCFPDEQINKRLQHTKLSLSVYEAKVNSKSYSEPLSSSYIGKVFEFSTSLQRKYNILMNAIKFSSDDGLFFESINEYNSYHIDSITERIRLELGTELHPTNFGQINFEYSGKKEVYNRFYPKVQSIIPSIVAFYHISVFISKILIKFFKQGDLEEYVIKEIFDLNIYENLTNCKNEIKLSDLLKTIPKILPEKKEPETIFQNGSMNRIIEEQKENNNIIKENLEIENVHNDVVRKKVRKCSSTKEREKIIFDNFSNFSKIVEDLPNSTENNICYNDTNKNFVKVNNFFLNENEKYR